jgi:hypothetical protein
MINAKVLSALPPIGTVAVPGLVAFSTIKYDALLLPAGAVVVKNEEPEN